MNIKIEHVAIWTNNLEELKQFYITYFNAKAGGKYFNPNHQFESYFLDFGSGARLELMRMPGLLQGNTSQPSPSRGLVHLSFSTGSRDAVDALTKRLEADGNTRLDGPRETGDGYYESTLLDPDGNRLEITI